MNKLNRLKNNKHMLGGVANGLANYFKIDVTLIRILFVGLFFTPTPIVLLYVLLWIVMPVAEDQETKYIGLNG